MNNKFNRIILKYQLFNPNVRYKDLEQIYKIINDMIFNYEKQIRRATSGVARYRLKHINKKPYELICNNLINRLIYIYNNNIMIHLDYNNLTLICYNDELHINIKKNNGGFYALYISYIHYIHKTNQKSFTISYERFIYKMRKQI